MNILIWMPYVHISINIFIPGAFVIIIDKMATEIYVHENRGQIPQFATCIHENTDYLQTRRVLSILIQRLSLIGLINLFLAIYFRKFPKGHYG